jgi:hypothetical protein
MRLAIRKQLRQQHSLRLACAALLLGWCSSGLAANLPDTQCSTPAQSNIQSTNNILSPPQSDGPTVVDLALEVVELNDIDVLNGRFDVQAYTDLAWCDPRLAFSESGLHTKAFAGSAARAQQEMIWSPDLTLSNAATSIDVHKRELTIRSDGRVRLRGFFTARLVANFDLTRFPFDTQHLMVQASSLTWNDDIVTIRLRPGGTEVQQDFDLAEWHLGEVSSAVRFVSRGSSEISFASAEITTTIHRKTGYYLWKAALPLILIVGLGWTVFWMPDGLTNRIRLSATVMLTIVAYQFALSADLPKIADINLFTAFMTLSFLMVALTVVVNVYVFSRAANGHADIVNRSDRLCRWLIPAIYVASVAAVASVYLL